LWAVFSTMIIELLSNQFTNTKT